MLAKPKCFIKNCIHYKGVTWLGEEESTEVNFCNAFPQGIPNEIAYGDNLHLKPLEDQGNDMVFEDKPIKYSRFREVVKT